MCKTSKIPPRDPGAVRRDSSIHRAASEGKTHRTPRLSERNLDEEQMNRDLDNLERLTGFKPLGSTKESES